LGVKPRTKIKDSATSSNIDVVLRGYEAFNRGDVSAALEALDPEIEWKTYLVPGPGGGTYRGHAGVRELWGDARNIFGDFRNDPERLIEAGDDKVVAFITVRGRGKASGAEVKARIAHVHTLHDGKVVRVESFENRDEALKVAGLGS
jgi:ketosteroid isomerase-like protein